MSMGTCGAGIVEPKRPRQLPRKTREEGGHLQYVWVLLQLMCDQGVSVISGFLPMSVVPATFLPYRSGKTSMMAAAVCTQR